MGLEKVKNFWQEFINKEKEYLKVNKILWVTLYLLIIIIYFISSFAFLVNNVNTNSIFINRIIFISYLILIFSSSIVILNLILFFKEKFTNNNFVKRLNEIIKYYFDNKTFICIYLIIILMLPVIFLTNYILEKLNIMWALFTLPPLLIVALSLGPFLLYVENKFVNKEYLKKYKPILLVLGFIISILYNFIYYKYDFYSTLIKSSLSFETFNFLLEFLVILLPVGLLYKCFSGIRNKFFSKDKIKIK